MFLLRGLARDGLQDVTLPPFLFHTRKVSVTAMSSPSQMQPALPAKVLDLLSLRAELDRLDDTLHDTLMRWSPCPKGTPAVQGLVAHAAAPDPSGRDCSLLGLGLADTDRMRLGIAMAAAGFRAGPVIVQQGIDGSAACALAEVEGFVGGDDPRLLALPGPGCRPTVLGAYAVPVGGGV